jgi:hypothetical protein
MKAICQLCDYEYAEVALDALRYPMTGAMFKSPDEFHGIEAPFDASIGWELFRCPMGRAHRPMVQDDLIRTDQGMVSIPRDGGGAFIDDDAPKGVDRAERYECKRVIGAAKTATGGNKGSGFKVPQEIQPTISPLAEEVKLSFACPECGKTFDTDMQLKGHMIAHKRVKGVPNKPRKLKKGKRK